MPGALPGRVTATLPAAADNTFQSLTGTVNVAVTATQRAATSRWSPPRVSWTSSRTPGHLHPQDPGDRGRMDG
ncbi:hypothetical protein [Arthrobacter pityocampae]|uniref:hypothetical protein n=1 Tax=Arthrobacter pityocampae TaxID=547334 RepID=UPI0037360B10